MAEGVSQLRELAALAAGTRPRVPAPRHTALWGPAVAVLRGALSLAASWSVTGGEHVPATGPIIVACNHFSFLDPPMLAATFPRPGHVLAKRELFAAGLGPVIAWLGAIPVNRGEADVDALAMTLDALAQGRVIAIFPEGTRGRERPSALKAGRRGVALMAHLSGAPVVPVGIAGTDVVERLSDLARMPLRRPHFDVRIGSALTFERYDRLPPSAVLTATTDAIMRGIALQLPARYRGVYGDAATPGARATSGSS